MRESEPLLYVLAHPLRQRIIAALREAGPMSIGDIANTINFSSQVVGFHVVTLEQHGLVEREMQFANPRARAEAKFRPTEKIAEALKAAQSLA